jgi:hypothetical protein
MHPMMVEDHHRGESTDRMTTYRKRRGQRATWRDAARRQLESRSRDSRRDATCENNWRNYWRNQESVRSSLRSSAGHARSPPSAARHLVPLVLRAIDDLGADVPQRAATASRAHLHHAARLKEVHRDERLRHRAADHQQAVIAQHQEALVAEVPHQARLLVVVQCDSFVVVVRER